MFLDWAKDPSSQICQLNNLLDDIQPQQQNGSLNHDDDDDAAANDDAESLVDFGSQRDDNESRGNAATATATRTVSLSPGTGRFEVCQQTGDDSRNENDETVADGADIRDSSRSNNDGVSMSTTGSLEDSQQDDESRNEHDTVEDSMGSSSSRDDSSESINTGGDNASMRELLSSTSPAQSSYFSRRDDSSESNNTRVDNASISIRGLLSSTSHAQSSTESSPCLSSSESVAMEATDDTKSDEAYARALAIVEMMGMSMSSFNMASASSSSYVSPPSRDMRIAALLSGECIYVC